MKADTVKLSVLGMLYRSYRNDLPDYLNYLMSCMSQ